MGMPAQQTDWTADMVRALPDDGNRYEVLDGVLFVSPAPTLSHQDVLGRLFVLISSYVRQYALGWTFLSPADVEFSPKRLVQPDLFVVPNTGQGKPRTWREVKALLLTVEVRSPSTARLDRVEKRQVYQDERVPEYWIVDQDSRVVDRWTPGDLRPEVLENVLEWQPKAGIPPLRIVLVDLFNPDAD
jgi:Uma2 family endonuclease